MAAKTWLALCLAVLPPQSGVQRPRDPWVFRSVLDGRARMVTVALANEIWVAYDATSCGLTKAWKGGVHFDGAVYTTVHGPQPTSEGEAYVLGAPGPAWQFTDAEGKTAVLAPRWRGYVLANGQVRLRYDLSLPGGAVARVEETPEFVRPEKLFDDPTSQAPWLTRGLVGLRRTFTATGIPPGTSVSVAVEADCVGYFMERLAGAVDRETVLADGSKGRHVEGRVPLDAAVPSNDVTLYFRPKGDAK
jgi:hypothetical protein